MASMLTPADPDYVAFKSGDETYYLDLAWAFIQRWCGWHISPSLTMTVPKLFIGSAGLVMLPSLHVTDVSEVLIGENPTPLLDSDYTWFRQGFIHLNGVYAAGSAWSGFWGGYNHDRRQVAVTMTHGYDTVPIDLKQVAYELVNSTADMPSGNVKDIQTPGFRLQFSQAAGFNLNDGQAERLSPYKLSRTR